MGMPVLLEIVDASATQADYDNIFDYLTGVDERFSTYKDTSEVSRINRQELSENEYSDEMREVIELSKETSKATKGYFSVTTPEGSFDPSGLVKGWAIQRAASMLSHKGFGSFYLEIAGDIQTSGVNREGKPWRVGVRNPFAREEVVKVIYPGGKGIATSGTYVRGKHLYNPHSLDHTPDDFVSLTVIGPNVYEADRYATAAFVMGKEGMHFLEALPDFEAYAIDAKGIAVMTSNFERYLIPLTTI